MRKGNLVLAGTALFLLAQAASAFAGQTLADLSYGNLWYGSDIKPEALKDRVVVVDFWGFN